MIESAKRNDGSKNALWFRGEASPHAKKAADREVLERLQIYERLHAAESDKASLEAMYKYFDITPTEKMKKSRLVDCLCKYLIGSFAFGQVQISHLVFAV